MNLKIRQIFLILGDVFLLYLSLLGMIFFGFWGNFSWQLFFAHLLPFSVLYLFWLIIFYIFGLYELNLIRTKINFYPRALGGLISALILGIVFFYLIPIFGITPKTNLFLNVLIFGILFLTWREFFYSVFSSRFLNRMAILGKDQQKIDILVKEITNRPYLGYKLVAIFDSAQNLYSKICEKKINTLIVDESEIDFDFLEELYQCLETRINFLDWKEAYEFFYEKIPVAFLDKKWFLKNLKEEEKNFYDKIKIGLDKVISAAILILSLPLWLLIILAIKLEDGGFVIYRQQRISKGRRPFFLLKFRSMKVDAEDQTGPVWAEKEDPRTTKVGKFLRKFHFDELPQMINILKGEVSLVGPRPERLKFVEELEKKIPHYHIRHLIKPGFTGWAQFKFRYGRSMMDAKEKFQYDLYYLKNRSLILDLKILLKTFQLFFKKE